MTTSLCLIQPAAAAAGRHDQQGQTSLGQLSGGERTLVALALMLAVCLGYGLAVPYVLCFSIHRAVLLDITFLSLEREA